MRNCVFSEMLLVSFLEKRAKRIRFHPRTTTIVGENDTGKSALLKSIYWTFGAEPAESHPKWGAANVASLIRFAIDDTKYSVLRQGGVVSLFDAADRSIGSYSGVTTGLGPVLARLFDFGVVRTDRSGQRVTPPPAYFFLPFYVDQDRGWTDNWSSFARLSQLSNYRQFMSEYHSGLQPNEYYRLTAEKDEAKQRLQQVTGELNAVRAARRTLDERLPFQGFNLDPVAFADDVGRLLTQSSRLAQDEDRYRREIQDRRARLATIDMQISAVQLQLGDLSADLRFATDKLPDEVECPVCGTLHRNSFAERFAIARDEDRCRELLIQLREDRSAVADGLGKATELFTAASKDRAAIDAVLATTKGEIQLRDVIEAQGRSEVQRVFAESITAYVTQARSIEVRIEEIERRIRELQDRKRQSAIRELYRSLMRQYVNELDVQNLEAASYSAIDSKIREIGSDKPRALLAYYYSFLRTMKAYSSSVFCPIVIDEPNQQGLDPQTLQMVLRFIFQNQPEESQLILGVENLHGVQAPGETIALTEKWSLLSLDEFEDVAGEVRPMIKSTFNLESEA